MKQYFTDALLGWHETAERPLPWKGEKNPYLIWLSEIILQQTRAEQGMPYFLRFREHYPDVKALADAGEDEVMRLWKGLGYYSRARNLHTTAKYISDELNGNFPRTFEEMKKLKGVGDYTAAAIASFAFDKPHAVVDGNVYRVLARFFGVKTPADSTEGKKEFTALANELIDPKRPGAFNQAIMDFGAVQCKPGLPDCANCPLSERCYAFNKGEIDVLPVKSKKIKQRTRFFHYLVIRKSGAIYLRKRQGKDIWKNLYDFPLVEGEALLSESKLRKQAYFQQLIGERNVKNIKLGGTYSQTLTHQKIQAVFYEIEVEQGFIPPEAALIETKREKLDNFAFPKIVDCYLKDKTLYLNLK